MSQSSSRTNSLHITKPTALSLKLGIPPTVHKAVLVPRRSSSYNFAGVGKESYGSIRLSRSRTFHSLTRLQEQYDGPSRGSKSQPPTPPASSPATSPQVIESTKIDDPVPFPFQPGPLYSPSYSTSRKLASRPICGPNHFYQTPPTTPDRFIPMRRSRESLSKTFRLSKVPSQLSSSERITRHRCASRDPFRRQARHHVHPVQRPYTPPINTRPVRQGNFGILPTPRAASAGAIWNVGGALPVPAPEPMTGVHNGRGGVLGSGTNAPMFTSDFLIPDTTQHSNERFEGRLAAALEIDQSSRMLNFSPVPNLPGAVVSRDYWPDKSGQPGTIWNNGTWLQESSTKPDRTNSTESSRPPVPSTPFRVLDAPLLRDDFYCSVLAYCTTSKTLAVGLRNRVYLWSEAAGVTYPPRNENDRRNTYVASLSFSSTAGGHSILAVGRSSGKVTLWSLHDEEDRCEWSQENAIACVSFKPVTTKRPSINTGHTVEVEELLVGDEVGSVYYYSIEWTNMQSHLRHQECVTLLAKIDIHTQQICGIAWDHDGHHFATGGNDNVCLLFSVRNILAQQSQRTNSERRHRSIRFSTPMAGMIPNFVPNATSHHTLSSMLRVTSQGIPANQEGSTLRPHTNGTQPVGYPLNIRAGMEMHRWVHSAAVKAIAFCPWQRGLIATGGGSNDRAIHFFHAWSGACLATINVQAQVTSLIWSNTRREIAATFGYAQPEHQYRIAVFSWPDCQQVVAIPWAGDLRALYAVAYPGGPNERRGAQRGEGERWWRRTAEEGCIVVASSDESVKFHEVWSGGKRATKYGVGGLGWSDILEGLEGVDKEGDIIR